MAGFPRCTEVSCPFGYMMLRLCFM